MDFLDVAKQRLLEPSGLTEKDLEKTLNHVLGHSVDRGDVYLHHARHESFMVEDGIVKEGNFSIDQGVGIRAISGEKTGFAYCDDLEFSALRQAAGAARSIARIGQQGQLQVLERSHSILKPLYTQESPLESMSTEEKLDLIRKVEQFAKAQDPRVIQVIVSLNGVFETVLIADSLGTFQADVRPLVRLNVNVIVESKGKRETGSFGGGGRYRYEYFIQEEVWKDYAQEAVRMALVNLESIEAPAGTMEVVLGPGWPGVLLHEAVGHGLEGDFNRKQSSTFSNRVGERVATPCCTVVDDGTLPDRRGSLNIDDEGTPTQRNVLIEDGILKGYLQDKLNAQLMGVAPTGNGRRESYASVPMPRMTNTFMLPGKYPPQEIISSVKKGLYAVNFGGGSVDITSGKFVFSASEAYLIENGQVTVPVKGATLIGNGPQVMTKISMVGNDLKLDSGVGTCGKEGQSVPVGVGQPTLKVDEITVGGTQK